MSKFAFRVTKDSKGFEDIESFWKASDAVVEPIDSSSADEFLYDTSSSISVSEDESNIDPTEKEISISSIRTVSEESSLSLPENSSGMYDEQETDPQESDNQETEKKLGKPPIIPNPNRRASAPGAINLPSSQAKIKKTTPPRQESKKSSNSPFDAGRLSIIGGVENPVIPTPEGRDGRKEFDESDERFDTASPDFGDPGQFDEEDGNNTPFDYEQQPSPKPVKKSVPKSLLETKSNQPKKTSSKQVTPKKTVRHSVLPESEEEEEFESPPTNQKNNRRISFASTIMDTPGSDEFPVGRQVDDDSFSEPEDGEGDTTMDLDTSGYTPTKGYVETSFLRASKKGVYESDDDNLSLEGGEEEDSDEGEEGEGSGRRGLRKSRRKTKGKRLQFWKNERSVYMKGKMMGLLIADPTPAKPKRKQVASNELKKNSTATESNKRRKKQNTTKKLESETESDQERYQIPPTIPKQYRYIEREGPCVVQVLNQEDDSIELVKTICPVETLHPPSALPVSALRPPGKDGVGLASQSFNVEPTTNLSGWITGFMELPPQAIKDAECVGEACQVFVVGKCQSKALEFGLANPEYDDWKDQHAQRVLLNSGDFFYVPPGNIYRLENHSKTTSALIYWTIIRPISSQNDNESVATEEEQGE